MTRKWDTESITIRVTVQGWYIQSETVPSFYVLLTSGGLTWIESLSLFTSPSFRVVWDFSACSFRPKSHLLISLEGPVRLWIVVWTSPSSPNSLRLTSPSSGPPFLVWTFPGHDPSRDHLAWPVSLVPLHPTFRRLLHLSLYVRHPLLTSPTSSFCDFFSDFLTVTFYKTHVHPREFLKTTLTWP